MAELKVEVFASEPSGRLSPMSALPERFASRAHEIADSVTEVADRFRERLSQRESSTGADHAWHLDEVRITFQLALEAGSGVIIATGKAGATFTVDVMWKHDTTTPASPRDQVAGTSEAARQAR
jgi:hypothetical protein